MDSPSPSSPAAPASAPRLPRVALLAVVLGLALYALFLSRHSGAYAGGADSSGYLNHARLLASGHVRAAPRAIPELPRGQAPEYLYVPLGFRTAPGSRSLVPTYPAGVPLLLAATGPLFGWDFAPHLVAVLHGVLGVLLAYAAARQFGLSASWSLTAAAIVAGSPLYLNMALQTLSDVPALVWTTAAVLAAWRSQTDRRWAIAAGFTFAFAVLVRPTNLLSILPIACALGLDWRRWAGFIIAGAPGGIFFLLHTHAAYGKYFTTGYGDSAGLEWALVPQTLMHYVRWLPVLFTPVVIGIFALPLHLRAAPRAVVVLAAWVLVFTGFYAAYYNTHETWWYLRFLLPAAIALIVGGMLGLRAVLARVTRSRRVGVLVLFFAFAYTVANSFHLVKKLDALGPGHGEEIYPLTARWLRENLPANAVVAVMQHSGALHYYTDFTLVRWDQMNAAEFAHVRAALEAAKRPLYAALFPFEVDEQKALEQRMPGAWKKIGEVRDTRIWQFDFGTPGRP